jgi:hypothetical protein
MRKFLVTAIVVIGLLCMARPAPAQFIGGIVYDPTNYQNAVLRYYQLRLQLAQMQATYSQILRMAMNLQNMPQRYLTSWSPWRYSSARDVYGNTTPWINGANSGLPSTVFSGYSQATTPLQTYNPAALATMPTALQQELEARYATVELGDGANENALETMGAIRANAAGATTAVGNIENDSLSNNPTLNTEVSVLTKVNATGVLDLQTAQDTNKLQSFSSRPSGPNSFVMPRPRRLMRTSTAKPTQASLTSN